MDNIDEVREFFSWPETKDVPTIILAEKIAEFCTDLNNRQKEVRNMSLDAALVIWSQLSQALSQAGRQVGLSKPVMPGWANQPVVALEGYTGNKPKSKRRVMEIALSVGDGEWATIGELWLWVFGAGPIVERTLYKFGYLKEHPGFEHGHNIHLK